MILKKIEVKQARGPYEKSKVVATYYADEYEPKTYFDALGGFCVVAEPVSGERTVTHEFTTRDEYERALAGHGIEDVDGHLRVIGDNKKGPP